MNNDSIRAQPPLDFIPPVYNAFVLKGCQFICNCSGGDQKMPYMKLDEIMMKT
jgi:hypothetical protein